MRRAASIQLSTPLQSLQRLFAMGVDGGLYFVSPTTTGVAVDAQVTTLVDSSGRGRDLTFSGSGRTLRQVGNVYYIEMNGTDDKAASAATFTIRLPTWVASVFTKGAENANSIFGAFLNSTNYIRLANASSSSLLAGQLREGTIGIASRASLANSFPINTLKVADTLSVVGLTDIAVDNGPVLTVANSWLTTTTIANAAIGLNLVTPSVGNAQAQNFYGGLVLADDPKRNRHRAVTLLARAAGLAL